MPSIIGFRTIGLIYGPIWIAIAITLWGWGVAVLTIKRLHDLKLSGLHLIWIWLVNAAIPAFASVSPTLSVLASLIALGTSLWLLFAPSRTASNAPIAI
jgi:uncharacterized membrane protein YhaH (DUF805 family)